MRLASRLRKTIELKEGAMPEKTEEAVPHGGSVMGDVLFECFAAGPLGCNCSIVGDPVTRRGLVVDPGGDVERIMDVIERFGLTIESIVHTHAHLDHMYASAALHARIGAPLAVHKADRRLWMGFERQCERLGMTGEPPPAPDRWLKDGDDLACCGGVALHTPGHTAGSMSFAFSAHRLLVAGDTLFLQGVGRTDLAGGSFRQIERSIVERLFTLPEETLVVTGHGPNTSIGYERETNPFIGRFARG
jgi:glyoxylase-like metal-dependent hydrolase (beta-lactamase superfamily II)